MVQGVGHWAREWDHVSQVFCVRYNCGNVNQLYWDHGYIQSKSIQSLRQEFRVLCLSIDYIWFYSRSRYDEIRIVDYLFQGEAVMEGRKGPCLLPPSMMHLS
jgi:hypothetical protein